MNTLYSTKVTVINGRSGQAKSTDGKLDIRLSLPKVFGGDDGAGTNPEQLFGAGYAACFASTLYFTALGRKVKLETPKVEATVDVLADPAGGFRLRVALEIEMHGIDSVLAEEIIEGAKQACPYHKLAKGNIEQTYRLVLR